MQITYDTKADALYIKLRGGKFVANKEIVEGIIFDMGKGDVLLGIEILEASMRFRPEDLARVEIKGGEKMMQMESKKAVIKELEYAKHIHEGYATRARTAYSRNWHLRWVGVYRNALYYLNKGLLASTNERGDK